MQEAQRSDEQLLLYNEECSRASTAEELKESHLAAAWTRPPYPSCESFCPAGRPVLCLYVPSIQHLELSTLHMF